MGGNGHVFIRIACQTIFYSQKVVSNLTQIGDLGLGGHIISHRATTFSSKYPGSDQQLIFLLTQGYFGRNFVLTWLN